ncbi:MAG: DUF429 domain-containing protein [Vampirovibrionales bacterium]|nr:DUF429 domain-containing protein [Vampirovibrionales bacterium]
MLKQTVLGIDFTSAPRTQKPITGVLATLAPTPGPVAVLQAHTLLRAKTWAAFEAWFVPGHGVAPANDTLYAAIDAPLSFPAVFWQALGWGEASGRGWRAYAKRLSKMTMAEFEALVKQYSEARLVGQKLPYRLTDTLTRSSSPVRLYRVPVGRMAFKLWPVLLRRPEGFSVLPVAPLPGAPCVLLEAYPALVARACVGRAPYKSDTRALQTSAHRDARQVILSQLQAPADSEGLSGLAPYGIRVELDAQMQEALLEDATGDALDALLACVQGAWAVRQKTLSGAPYGIPEAAEAQEGWIVDPASLTAIDDWRANR